jgi:hypothetical protein
MRAALAGGWPLDVERGRHRRGSGSRQFDEGWYRPHLLNGGLALKLASEMTRCLGLTVIRLQWEIRV